MIKCPKCKRDLNGKVIDEIWGMGTTKQWVCYDCGLKMTGTVENLYDYQEKKA